MCERFPQRLKQLRTRKGTSQRVLSELCGLGKNAVSRYESGDNEPTLPALLAFADYFCVTLDDLVGRKG